MCTITQIIHHIADHLVFPSIDNIVCKQESSRGLRYVTRILITTSYDLVKLNVNPHGTN